MKNKLTVATEFGTFSRSTNRQYKFVVIACGVSPSVLENRLNREISWKLDENARYAEIAEGRKPVPAEYAHVCSQSWYQERVAGFPARLEELISQKIRIMEANAKAIATKTGDLVGWSSRLDLAQGMANVAKNDGRLNVTIVPVPEQN